MKGSCIFCDIFKESIADLPAVIREKIAAADMIYYDSDLPANFHLPTRRGAQAEAIVEEDIVKQVTKMVSSGKKVVLLGRKKSTDSKSKLPQKLREQGVKLLEWSAQEDDKKALNGRKVVVAHIGDLPPQLMLGLREFGAEAEQLIVGTARHPQEKKEFARLVADVHEYDWLIFSCVEGVHRFFSAFFAIYQDARSLGRAQIAAADGAVAAAIHEYRFTVDVEAQNGEKELLKLLEKQQVENLTMLWVRHEEGGSAIYDGLMQQRAIVDECESYELKPAGKGKEKVLEGANLLIFTSWAAVEMFWQSDLPLPENCMIAGLGWGVSECAEEAEWKVAFTENSGEIPSILAATIEWAEENR